MAFTDITSTASVRAALGVSVRELPDTVLADEIYMTQLSEHFYALNADIYDSYVTIMALPTPTKIQQRFLDLMQTYSAYYVAKLCLSSISMFAPVTIKDSKTEVTRAADPFKNLRTDIGAMLATLKISLLTVYNQIDPNSPLPSAVERIRVVIAPLGVNPVTGA